MAQDTLLMERKPDLRAICFSFQNRETEKTTSKHILKQCQRRVQIMKTPDESILFTMQCMKIELQLVFVTKTCSLMVKIFCFKFHSTPEGSSLYYRLKEEILFVRLSVCLYVCTSSLQHFQSRAFKSSQNHVRPNT